MNQPELTEALRLRGLELRRERAEVKAWLSRSLPGQARGDIQAAFCWNCTAGMKVKTLLKALPNIGPKKAAALLEAAGIPEKNTVRGTGHRQRERLFALLAKKSPR